MGEQYFFLDSQDERAKELLEPFIAQAVLAGYLTTSLVADLGGYRQGYVLTQKAYQEGYDSPKRLLEVWLWRQKKAKESEEEDNGNVRPD